MLVASSPNPWAALALQTAGISSADLRSKSWSEFTKSGAPKMDFVISLDAETVHGHPIWHGQPETALWDYAPFTSKKVGNPEPGVMAVQTLMSLRRRIELLLSLHQRSVANSDLRHDLRDMAHL